MKTLLLSYSLLIGSLLSSTAELHGQDRTGEPKSLTAAKDSDQSLTFRSESSLKRQFMSFPGLRSEVLNLIGTAKERIWLSTNFLSDGEIVTALYVAKYRKLDVMTLLDRKQANNYLSRLDYLKRQNIPVFLKPDRFPISFPTALIIDNNVYAINANLDFLTPARSFQIEGISEALAVTWGKAFQSARTQAIPAVARPLPQVGRAGVHRNYYRPSMDNTVNRSIPQYKDDGAYNYDRSGSSRDKIPEGVAKKLPKETIYQQRSRSNIPSSAAENDPNKGAPSVDNSKSEIGEDSTQDILPSTP